MDKPLSDKQAQACENAVGKVCRCRCGGALHGRMGGSTTADGSMDRAYFESLPNDDPHRLLTGEEATAQREIHKEARKAKQREAREAKQRRINEAWDRLYSR